MKHSPGDFEQRRLKGAFKRSKKKTRSSRSSEVEGYRLPFSREVWLFVSFYQVFIHYGQNAPRLHRPERFQMIPGADTSQARLAEKMREKEVESQTIRTPARRAASQWRHSWMKRDG